ncbi:hypothetical protein BG015_009478 [Linnemannia schmuckeri]|uniref:Uncharacterized protein n=1 Tax=Linnemannia schmuckeri TaxID=64567 RepID=A0A9P5V9S5_9FUNG|nr:hypothetical protein BG015_009478 [Linnemannia schmuckeri]
MFPKTQTCQASDGTEAEIQTIHYLSISQYVIPWTNIVNAFPNEYLVKNGDMILPFLSDSYKIKNSCKRFVISVHQRRAIDPLCIAYQENAVLEVILSAEEQGSSYSLDSSFYPTRQFRKEARRVSEYRLATALSISETLSYYPPARSILTHTLQLQHNSSPHLFIVLPTRDSSTGELLDDFRLHYLCECGEHSQTPYKSNDQHHDQDKGGTIVSHDVHLVDHEGYRIVNLPAFFEKYGVYSLALLRMVKFGAIAGGMVVPQLLQFGAGREGGQAEEEESFEERVDFAFNRMQKMQQQHGWDFNSVRTRTFTLIADTPTCPSSEKDRTDITSWLRWEMFDELDSFLDGHGYDNADNNDSNTP